MGDTLDFMVVEDGTLRLVDESHPDPFAVAIAVANGAMHAVELEQARPRVTDRHSYTDRDQLRLHLERYLGPTPS